MAAINLPNRLVDDAKRYAAAFSRSVPKQIEHWARIGKIMSDNPDLTYEFTRDLLLAQEGASEPFDLSELDK